MAVTVSVPGNPNVQTVGTTAADLVTIYSGRNAEDQVEYFIMRQDRNPFFSTATNAYGDNVIRISTWETTTYDDVDAINAQRLRIRLDPNTKYRARVRWRTPPFINQWPNSTTYERWVNFTTRDKKYRTPDAVSQFTVTEVGGPQNVLFPNKRKKRLVVVNNAKSTVSVGAKRPGRAPRGARVDNTDWGYVGTTSITGSMTGVRVVNVNYYRQRKGNYTQPV